MKIYNAYLISDFTCETISSIARSIFVNFDSIKIESHLCPLVNSKSSVDDFIENVFQLPGIVMCTIFNEELQNYLIEECNRIGIVCIPAISGIIKKLEECFQSKISSQPITSRNIDTIKRIEAIEYTLSHDDGQNISNIDNAEIIIIGVSRTSKSPTSMYLAYRCFKVMNIPFVCNDLFPHHMFQKTEQNFVVGLTINPDKLVELRENRMETMIKKNILKQSNYTDYDFVKKEIREAYKVFMQHNWPIIDITNSSVEETAARIIKLYNTWKNKNA